MKVIVRGALKFRASARKVGERAGEQPAKPRPRSFTKEGLWVPIHWVGQIPPAACR